MEPKRDQAGRGKPSKMKCQVVCSTPVLGICWAHSGSNGSVVCACVFSRTFLLAWSLLFVFTRLFLRVGLRWWSMPQLAGAEAGGHPQGAPLERVPALLAGPPIH